MVSVRLTPAGGTTWLGSFGSTVSTHTPVLEQPRRKPPSDCQKTSVSAPVERRGSELRRALRSAPGALAGGRDR